METILYNINGLLNILYSSIKSEGYKLINSISIISTEIFNKEPIRSLSLSKNSSNLVIILNVIISGIILYYVFKSVLSLYSNTSISNIYYFLLKIIIISIMSSNALYICKEIVNVNYLLSNTIKTFLEDISHEEISYKFLEDNISTLDDFFRLEDRVGIEGIKDIIVCVYILALITFFSVRYFVINLCIILSPFLFLLLISSKTKIYFYLWLKIFIFNLSLQIINYFIIYIPIVSQKEDVYIPILIGSIIVMFKVFQAFGDLRIYEKD